MERGRGDRRVGAEAGREGHAGDGIDEADQGAEGEAPEDQGADQPVEARPVARADGLAAQHLGGAFEAVEDQRRQDEELIEDAVGGEHDRPLEGAVADQQQDRAGQQQGAQEQVAVEAQQGGERPSRPGFRAGARGAARRRPAPRARR